VVKQAVEALEFPGKDNGEQLARVARALRIEAVSWNT